MEPLFQRKRFQPVMVMERKVFKAHVPNICCEGSKLTYVPGVAIQTFGASGLFPVNSLNNNQGDPQVYLMDLLQTTLINACSLIPRESEMARS